MPAMARSDWKPAPCRPLSGPSRARTAIQSRHLEALEFAALRAKSARRVIEPDADLTGLGSCGAEERSQILDLFLKGDGARRQRKPRSNLLLVWRMDIAGCPQVERNGHPGLP